MKASNNLFAIALVPQIMVVLMSQQRKLNKLLWEEVSHEWIALLEAGEMTGNNNVKAVYSVGHILEEVREGRDKGQVSDDDDDNHRPLLLSSSADCNTCLMPILSSLDNHHHHHHHHYHYHQYLIINLIVCFFPGVGDVLREKLQKVEEQAIRCHFH